MLLRITRADFGDPALVAFLEAHLVDLAPTAPAQSRHALDLDGLARPGVRLWTGWLGRDLVATGALAPVEGSHEEIKSMRTSPPHRGRGLAREMVAHLVADARRRGVERVSLETGSMDFFAPARALYRSQGFEECPPFGSYRLDPNSVFFAREL